MQSQAYFLQYISLMLIVICFIIATDEMKPSEKSQKVITKVTPIKQHSQIVLLQDSFTDLFHPDTAELDETTLNTLKALLMAHDIRADVTLSATDTHRYPLLVSRSIALRKALSDVKLPTEALHVRAQLKRAEKPIDVQITRNGQ